MLKIKDNVDLKELEKFGFKPKYDEDTGEIKKYVKKAQYSNCFIISFEKDQKILGNYEIVNYWGLYIEKVIKETIDLLYDLIQAGLVEKIGD